MLLYAKTGEAIQLDNTYLMSGNKISVRTLDLNRNFNEIAQQLYYIIEEHFGTITQSSLQGLTSETSTPS